MEEEEEDTVYSSSVINNTLTWGNGTITGLFRDFQDSTRLVSKFSCGYQKSTDHDHDTPKSTNAHAGN